MCFSEACQHTQDIAFAAAVLLPLAAAAAAAAWFFTRPPAPGAPGGGLLTDSDTGVVFEVPPGAVPERDRAGELVFRALSYTLRPVEVGEAGDRVRVAVGPAKARTPRTFLFER